MVKTHCKNIKAYIFCSGLDKEYGGDSQNSYLIESNPYDFNESFGFSQKVKGLAVSDTKDEVKCVLVFLDLDHVRCICVNGRVGFI